MRRILLAGAATGVLVLSSLAGLAPASAGSSGTGTYVTPFREDNAVFANSGQVGGTFTGGSYVGQPTDANGCVANPVKALGAPLGNPDAYNCLPAGASMVQLSNGQILFWDAVEGTETGVPFGGTNFTLTDLGRVSVNDESRLLSLTGTGGIFSKPGTPDGGAHNTSTAEDLPLPAPFAATHYAYNNGSLFCSDQVLLSDGSVLATGGTDYYTEPTIPGTNKGVVELEGIKSARVFSAETNSWNPAASMNYGRWYPSLVTLGNGHVFVASGVTKLVKPVYPTHLLDSGTNVKQTETYDPLKNVWTDNGAGAQRSLPLYPRLHLLPNGHVYYDAAGQDFSPAGEAYDEALWNIAATYDPNTKTWHDLGIPGLLSPGVNPLFAGFRGSTFSAALQLRPSPNVTYTKASFLTAGGVLGPTPGLWVAVNDSRIDTVTTDSAGGNEQLTTSPTGSLGRGRWFSTAVPLPDGTVYAVNGADVDEVVTPGLESPILTSELFTPTIDSQGNYTGGTWRDAGQEARKRTYHNNAILLPDGSVLIGGNAPIPFLYSQVINGIDLPGRPGTNNHHDASFQIYRPPYWGSPRPVVTGIDTGLGQLTIHTPQWATIASVVMMRNTAQTHLIDGDARSVMLPIQNRDATTQTVTVTLPRSTNVLPNGPYLLFANATNTNNVMDSAPGHVTPSIGAQVMVSGIDPAQPPLVIVPSTTVFPAAAASSLHHTTAHASATNASATHASAVQAGTRASNAKAAATASAAQNVTGRAPSVSGAAVLRSGARSSVLVRSLGALAAVLILLVGLAGVRGRRRWQRAT